MLCAAAASIMVVWTLGLQRAELALYLLMLAYGTWQTREPPALSRG